MSASRLSRVTAFARAQPLAVGALLATLLLVGGFVQIADEMAEGATSQVDTAILDALRAGDPGTPIGPAWLTTAAADFTALGSITVLAFLVTGVAVLFAAIGRLRQAVILLAASVGALLWSEALKAVFDRPRPEAAYHAVEVVNASFPSGHALLSASVYLSLGVLCARFAARRRVRALALGAALLTTLLVGASRVFLGVHWASDVAAGWSLGGAWALICWLALWAWERRWRG